MNCRLSVILLLLVAFTGCGTTKWTDTRRSATEQLLITDAIDRAVSRLDFRALAGKTVYLDKEPIRELADADYLASCLRQHLLASGCIVRFEKTEADYMVEVRAGAVGTDRHDLLYGVPAVNVPTILPVTGFGIPPQIPEIPFVKRTDQRAVAKIALFAYNRTTGRPIWQSGSVPAESDAKAIWVFGAGPFQRGSIYDGTNLAGDRLKIPLIDLGKKRTADAVSVADEAYFIEPVDNIAQTDPEASDDDPASPDSAVVQADHQEPADSTPVEPPAAAAPVAVPPPGETPPADPLAGGTPSVTLLPENLMPVGPELSSGSKVGTPTPTPTPASDPFSAPASTAPAVPMVDPFRGPLRATARPTASELRFLTAPATPSTSGKR